MNKLFTFLFCLIILSSCDLSKRIDTSKAVEEMELRKVKRILPREIVAEATRYGQEIEKILKSDSISLDSIQKKYKVNIYSGDLKSLSLANLDPKLMEVIDAMDYAIENNQNIPSTIQRNSKEDSLFYIFNNEKITYLVGFSKQNIILNYQ